MEGMRVLQNLVGKTLFFPDLDAGNAYRKSVRGEAGHILTRDGHEIKSTGIFGASQTDVLPLRQV